MLYPTTRVLDEQDDSVASPTEAVALSPSKRRRVDGSQCNLDFFEDRWAIVRDLLFEEYAVVRAVPFTVSHIDLVNDTVAPDITVYAVHNAQVRATCKAFRDFFKAKSSELVWRKEPAADVIHGTFVCSDGSR